MKKIIFGEDEIKDIVNLTLNGISTKTIKNKYNCSSSTILRLLEKNNITRPSRTYNVNEKYFDNIDTEDKAYFLGFLYADGNVSKVKNAISLEIQERDKPILELFAKFSENTKPFYFRKRNNENWSALYTFHISSKYMKNTLFNYGLTPNKSLVLKFPKYINDDLIQHFIRGYFDGDGCISYGNSNKSLRFSVTGTLNFISTIQKILMEKCNLNENKIHTQGTIFTLEYSGNIQVIRIKDYLYKGATIFLERKFNKFTKQKPRINPGLKR